jgi:uncharacterized protein (TIGR03067 family)
VTNQTEQTGPLDEYWPIRSRTYRVRIDAAKRPYRVELFRPDARTDPAAPVRVGVYKFEDGHLLVAWPGRDGQVPKDFSGKGGHLMVLRKEVMETVD